MKAFSILYYTDDSQKFSDFREKKCGPYLPTTYRFGTRVVIHDSFKEDSTPIFSELQDLAGFLNDYDGDLSDLTVIIDCCLARKEYGMPIRNILIEYPEVKFLFDSDPKWVIFDKEEIPDTLKQQSAKLCAKCMVVLKDSTVRGEVKQSFKKSLNSDSSDDTWSILKKLIPRDALSFEAIRKARQYFIRQIAIESVLFNCLTLPEVGSYFVLDLIHSKDNLFDASNIRYAIKQWKYAELDVHSRNFSIIQESRRDHLAISVEEEDQQNRINSYCLYANGYRVLPVTTARELAAINKDIQGFNPSIIVRDYDLQFYDASSIESCNGDSRQTINFVRGFRDNLGGNWETHVFKSPFWSSFYNGCFKETERDPHHFTHLPDDARICISDRNSIQHPIYFVSKGTWNVRVLPPDRFIETINKEGQQQIKQLSHYYTHKDKGELCIPGLNKPLSGIYAPFMCIPEVRKRLDSIKPSKEAYLDTSREGHSHGTPLDIYSLVVSWIQRAEIYYQNEKYIHAAILATEAIEYLNGFHEALLLKAYQLLAICENAIAMNTVGGDEEFLKLDADLRIRKIEDELDWLLRRVRQGKCRQLSYDERREFKYSLLTQIFSDCRGFCKEKEHFRSEDAFISAMAHVNEGFTPGDILHECIRIIKNVLNSFRANRTASIIDDDK